MWRLGVPGLDSQTKGTAASSCAWYSPPPPAASMEELLILETSRDIEIRLLPTLKFVAFTLAVLVVAVAAAFLISIDWRYFSS